MSKSYDNTIPLFATNSEWREVIKKIPTDSSRLDEPKDVSSPILFDIYKSIADKECIRSVKDKLERGDMGWGQLKHYLENLLDEKFSHYGQKYNEYISSPEYVEGILLDGAKKARTIAENNLKEVRKVIESL